VGGVGVNPNYLLVLIIIQRFIVSGLSLLRRKYGILAYADPVVIDPGAEYFHLQRNIPQSEIGLYPLDMSGFPRTAFFSYGAYTFEFHPFRGVKKARRVICDRQN
jgi:hypothetical protein